MTSYSHPPPSRLHSLKRSWSGNAQDLEEEEENFTVAPLAKTLKAKAPSQSSSDLLTAPTSSQTIVIEDDWQPTPPEQQKTVRNHRESIFLRLHHHPLAYAYSSL